MQKLKPGILCLCMSIINTIMLVIAGMMDREVWPALLLLGVPLVFIAYARDKGKVTDLERDPRVLYGTSTLLQGMFVWVLSPGFCMLVNVGLFITGISLEVYYRRRKTCQ